MQFSYMPDTIMDHARDVTIKLHHRVGKYLKINLYFAVKWIMLSEISFISSKLAREGRTSLQGGANETEIDSQIGRKLHLAYATLNAFFSYISFSSV